VVPAIERLLAESGLTPMGIWAAEHRWCSFDEALALVNYRGLKEGLRSTREYVTGLAEPSAELRLL
jgi:hypothetical protein